MKIGIIGMGFVGTATSKVFEKSYEILAYDKFKEPYTDPLVLKDADIVFVCVPTPMSPSGEIDYSPMHDSLKVLSEVTSNNIKKPLIIIRSTAVPGTTDKLESIYPFNFVFNPEFLREKYALEDMQNTDRVVLGANRLEDYKKAEEIYKQIFPNAKYINVDRKTAEMVKYAANVTLIGQISIANELYQICKVLGIDYDKVKDIILLDKRIGNNINVPGPDGDLGFGGKCFPKDLNALIFLSRENIYRPYLLEEIWRLNDRLRKNRDWLNIPGATSQNNKFQ
jgi:UDPglucose 6-dehydrogenase